MYNLHPLFDFFNRDRPLIPKDKSEWPRAWSIMEFKEYPRFPSIRLPKADPGAIDIVQALKERKSSRNFSGAKITLEEISTLLYFGAGITRKNENPEHGRRAYPSAGARYPIEIYPLILQGEGLKEGFYHYGVREHVLEFLWEREKKISDLFVMPFVEKASFILIFSMMPRRFFSKYGNHGFKTALIEAGHISQNMYLVSSALGLSCCALAGFDGAGIHESLDIDGESEIAFYAFAVGKA